MVVAVGPARKDSGDNALVRGDWQRAEVEALNIPPFADLMFQAKSPRPLNFDPDDMEIASLLSIKIDGCLENCGGCSQSVHYETGLKASRLMDCNEVVAAMQRPKDAGARFCLAAAWRNSKDCGLDQVNPVIGHGIGSMLTPKQSARLAAAGLEFCNHNVDSGPKFYGKTTAGPYRHTCVCARSRHQACCGSIVGMGERVETGQACSCCSTFPAIRKACRSTCGTRRNGAPVNDTAEGPDPIALVRLAAIARIMMPKGLVLSSAGRQYMTDEL